jgi:hypothetical protein
MVDRGPFGNVIGGMKMWTKKWERRAVQRNDLYERSQRAMSRSQYLLPRIEAAEAAMPEECWGLLADYLYTVQSWAKYAEALLDRLEQVDAA